MNATEMTTDTTVITIAGEGRCTVYPLSLLTVTINGSGTVLFKGNPVVQSMVNGSGTVKKMHFVQYHRTFI